MCFFSVSRCLTKDYKLAHRFQQTIAFLGVWTTEWVEDNVHSCRETEFKNGNGWEGKTKMRNFYIHEAKHILTFNMEILTFLAMRVSYWFVLWVLKHLWCAVKAVVCFLTLRADFVDFLHVVFGAVVDGVSYATLGNGLVFGGWRRAKNSHIWHSPTQLGNSGTNTT